MLTHLLPGHVPCPSKIFYTHFTLFSLERLKSHRPTKIKGVGENLTVVLRVGGIIVGLLIVIPSVHEQKLNSELTKPQFKLSEYRTLEFITLEFIASEI